MPTVLIVEDNPDNWDMLSQRLGRRGYQPVQAPTGPAAVAMAASLRPDIILMDMNIPGIDGWEATRQIKASPDLRSIPIIALTSHAMVGDRQKALAAGCDDYHAKPVVLVDLLRQMELALGKG